MGILLISDNITKRLANPSNIPRRNSFLIRLWPIVCNEKTDSFTDFFKEFAEIVKISIFQSKPLRAGSVIRQ